jgi:hypothetical protein
MGNDSGTATMSRCEFSHFVGGSKIFSDVTRVQEHIDACFAQANCEDSLLPTNNTHAPTDIPDSNPDEELLRFEFIECLIRLSQIRFSKAGMDAELLVEKGSNSAEGMEVRLNGFRKGKSTANDIGRSHADLFACELPMHETFERMMTEFVKPTFENKSTDNEVAKGLRTLEAQSLFAAHFDLLMVVYRHYACMESGGRAMATARPTMNLGEFQQLIQDSGLSLTLADRNRIAAAKKKLTERERRRRYARGNFEEPTDTAVTLSNDLTDMEIRQAFSCSQADDEEGLDETSELVFAEFVESVARVATLKWETQSMSFIAKVQLALESICGIADSIAIERKKQLMPEVDWEQVGKHVYLYH